MHRCFSPSKLTHLVYRGVIGTVLEDHPELELLSQALSFQSPSIKVGTRIEALSCKPVAKEKKQFRTLENDLASDMELSASISPPEDGTPTLQSVFGPLDKRNNRKTFWHLISTLNLAFPDFDFTNVPADDFAREPSASTVLASLSSALNHLRTTSNIGPSHGVYRSFSSYNPVAPSYTNGEGSPEDSANPLPEGDASKVTTHPYLREILDPIIDLDNCEVYSYMPDIESDPHAAESELGSVAASEAGDEDTDMGSQTPLDDGTLWSMEGVPSTPASPIVPETLQDQTRTLRSGQAYFTNSQARRFGRGRGRVRSALAPRSRSQTPHPYGDEESTGGLLWS